MAINPQIPLMVQAPDIGGAITRGLQGAQSLLAMRQAMEERERQKRLQPLQEQVLQAQVAALPGEAEDRARQRQFNIMKMNATSDFMLAKKLEPLIASQSWDKAAKLIEADKTVSEDSRSAILDAVNNKDILSSVSLINAAYENGYSVAGFKRPEVASSGKPITAVDPVTGERFFATVNAQGGLNRVTGGVPPPPVVQESNVSLEQKVTDRRIKDTLEAAKKAGISDEQYSQLEAIASTGDLGAAARFLDTVTTGSRLNASAFRSLFPEKSKQADRAIALAKRELQTLGKDAPQVALDSFKASESIAGQIGLYERALQLIDDGAGTGPIEKLFPAIKDASVELENLKGVLALEALGGLNLTPVSNADVQLLKDNAIPSLDEGFKEWAQRKIVALKKAQSFHNQRADYFQTGGARYQDWLNPQNWVDGSFSLISSANRVGGATTAITNPDVPFPPNVPPGRAPVTSRTLSQPIEVDF
jgi:hypothetical protein